MTSMETEENSGNELVNFSWRITNKILEKKVGGEEGCELCNNRDLEDTIQHSLVICPHARIVWTKFQRLKNTTALQKYCENWLDHIIGQVPMPMEQEL